MLSNDQRALYSVHGDENHATAFAVDPESGKLKLLGQADTGGKNGVRQMLDPSGKFPTTPAARWPCCPSRRTARCETRPSSWS